MPHKYALVTGASSGIGWHISKELAQRGYPILAISNQPQQLELLKNELENTCSVSVITLNKDLAQATAAKEIFDYCESGQLDIEVLVNNAGLLIFGEAIDVDYARAASILQLHITTPALLCQLFGKKNGFTKIRIHSERFFHFSRDALPGYFILRTFKNIYQVIYPRTEN